MDFMKIDPNIGRNAKVRRAGPMGLALYVNILGINGLESRDGVIPPLEAELSFLAWSANMTLEQTQDALDRCVAAGILRLEKDGSLAILGWDESWKPALSKTERNKRWLKKKDGRDNRDTARDSGRDTESPGRDGPSSFSGRQKEGGSDRANDGRRSREPRPSGAGSARRRREAEAEAESERAYQATQDFLAEQRRKEREWDERVAAEEAEKASRNAQAAS